MGKRKMPDTQQTELFSKISEEMQDKAEKQIEELQQIVDYEIREYTVELLVSKYKEGLKEGKNEIFIPHYQRKFVWDEKRQSKFIESLLIGLPIPYMFTADTNDGRSEIIDGSQRIRTLDYFLNNQLSLEGLEKLTALEGFHFKDLPLARQRRFKKKTVRLIELTDKAQWEVRKDMFERINSTPVVLTDMEIRRGAYEGRFMDFIQACSQDSRFHRLCPVSDKRSDREEYAELVIRFFAYSENLNKFVHSVKGFLDAYVAEKNKNGFDEEQMENRFQDMLDFVERYFPYGFKKTANHKSTPRVRFEAIAVGVGLAIRENPQLIPAEPVENWLIHKPDDFEEVATTDAANNKNKLLERIYFVRDKLLGTS